MLKWILDKWNKKKNTIDYWRGEGTRIGERCFVHPDADFGSEPYLISLGNHVRVNNGVKMITHDGGVWVLRELPSINRHKEIDLFGKISIGDNVHIGTNAIILPGVSIGSNSIIGVGAIVTRSIPENSIAVGIPARVIETVDDYYEKNKYKLLYTKLMTDIEKKNYLLKEDIELKNK